MDLKVKLVFSHKGTEKNAYIERDNIEDIPTVVLFQGEVWRAGFFIEEDPNSKYDLGLVYTKVPEVENPSEMDIDEVIGPENPKPIKCTCGSASTYLQGSWDPMAHADWCDVNVKNLWE